MAAGRSTLNIAIDGNDIDDYIFFEEDDLEVLDS